MAVITQIQFRRGTAAQWSSTNPVLSAGELGYETDTGNFKIGNGSTAWNSLSVLNGITASTAATFTNKTINLSSNTLSGTIAEFNTALSDGNFATIAGVETLTNKTLTSPTISNPTFTGQASGLEIAFGQFIVFEGATADDFELTLSAGDPTADRTVTLPDATTTLVGTGTTDTLTNKTINGSNNTITNVSLTTGVTGTLPAANGGTGVTSLGTGVATFLQTPTSANLAAALTDETGSGANVFANAPTLSGTVVASGDINMTATGGFGSVKDYQTLNLMGCL
jgi:hypothetical protein